MIIQIKKEATPEQVKKVTDHLASLGISLKEVKTRSNHYLIGVGMPHIDIRSIGTQEGIKDIHRVNDDYKLVSRKWRVQDTVIDLGDVSIKRGEFTIMAGPCSIEGEEQIQDTVAHLVRNGVRIMRGGVFKPRSSPYAFRGMGIEGLKIFYRECQKQNIKIITEVMQVSQIEEMYDYVDIFQVGARNSQNFDLLDALGRVDKPVMIKRGLSGTISELLQSAEYVFSSGNENILLCERGIRTYEKAYRNTLDLNAVPILKEKTHLPVIVDPSHGIGIRRYVEAMSLASVMAGADGVIVEVHKTPEKAFSDGQQNLDYTEAENLYFKIRKTFELKVQLEKNGGEA